MCIAKITTRPEEEIIHLLCYVLGKEAEAILLRILTVDNQRTTYKEVREAFDNNFAPRKNVIFEYRFNIRTQNPGEKVDLFITSYSLADKCDYGTFKDELIWMNGHRCLKLFERMQLTADLTLAQAVNLPCQTEACHKESKILQGQTPIGKVSRSR